MKQWRCRRPILQPCLVFAVLMISLSASAQVLSPDYGLIGAPMSNFLANSYLTQQMANDLSRGGQAEQGPSAAPIADAGASGLIAEPAGAPGWRWRSSPIRRWKDGCAKLEKAICASSWATGPRA